MKSLLLSAVFAAPLLIAGAEAIACEGGSCRGGGGGKTVLVPVGSGSNNSNAEALGAAQNQQQNTSQSTSVGGNNYTNQYLTEFGKTSTFEFSERGVKCESPRLSVGVWADPGSQYYNYGRRYQDEHDIRAGISLAIPLGAERATCQEMARSFEQRVKFDTAAGQAKTCQAMIKAGTNFNDELIAALPELEVCRSVAVRLTDPAPAPAPAAEVNSPIRGLW